MPTEDDPCDDETVSMRKQFYIETGKSPEQESMDSARAIGVTVLVGAVIAIVGLIAYFK